MEPRAFAPLGLGPSVVTPSRAVNFANLLETARKRVLTLVERLPSFPSLIISTDGLEPQGDFAKAQAQYLKPDPAQVDRLVKVLSYPVDFGWCCTLTSCAQLEILSLIWLCEMMEQSRMRKECLLRPFAAARYIDSLLAHAFW